jgi:transcriptional regulator with XRE-family HTH domain
MSISSETLNSKRTSLSLETESLLKDHFRHWLQSEYMARVKKNPRYSLRAFARQLEMEPSTISQILRGKRQVSPKIIRKICEQLQVGPNRLQELLVAPSQSPIASQDRFALLTQDAFEVISEWYHFAILELASISNFALNPEQCAKALMITPAQSYFAFERLERLNLLTKHKGKYVKTKTLLTNFKNGMTSAAHKLLQKQILSMALEAIDTVPQNEKDITCMTMAINEEKLDEARDCIKKFRRDMCEFLEEGERSRVYNLAIQLYPISKSTKQNNNLKKNK